jgi:hypothetical protein
MLRSLEQARECVERLRTAYEFEEVAIVLFQGGDEPLPSKLPPRRVASRKCAG